MITPPLLALVLLDLNGSLRFSHNQDQIGPVLRTDVGANELPTVDRVCQDGPPKAANSDNSSSSNFSSNFSINEPAKNSNFSTLPSSKIDREINEIVPVASQKNKDGTKSVKNTPKNKKNAKSTEKTPSSTKILKSGDMGDKGGVGGQPGEGVKGGASKITSFFSATNRCEYKQVGGDNGVDSRPSLNKTNSKFSTQSVDKDCLDSRN